MAIQLSEVTNQLKLYDQDYCLWLEKTSQLLRERRFNEIDINNLVEEIEGLTKSDRRAIRNRLTVLLEHLLKLAYWEQERELNARGWKNTIKEQRRQIKFLLQDSPSLKPFFLEIFQDCYRDAREDASDNTGLSIDVFPQECPFSVEQILEFDYLQ
jgi:hypothetical protein